MSFLRMAVSLVFLLSWSFTASAYDLSGQSSTYLQTRELTDGTRLTPLPEQPRDPDRMLIFTLISSLWRAHPGWSHHFQSRSRVARPLGSLSPNRLTTC
jgi:hypothetical protein